MISYKKERDGRLTRAAFKKAVAAVLIFAFAVTTAHAHSVHSSFSAELDEAGKVESFVINRGIAGAWYEPQTTGQGIMIDIEPETSLIFISWLSFEAADGAEVRAQEQRWLTAHGTFEGSGSADIPIWSTSGGIFDSTQPTITEQVGTLTIRFDSCVAGELDYVLDEGLTGSIALERLIPGSEELCQALEGPTVVEFFEEPVPLTETPPLPGDICAVPSTSRVLALESQIANTQQEAAATAAELLDPSRITVVTCGTGSPVPSDRVQSCTAVFVGGKYLLFDAGDGAAESIEDLQFPITDITAIFLTHFHSDHIADVGEVVSRSWINGRTELLPIYGGPVVERVVEGFNLIYSPDIEYRLAHHGKAIFPVDHLLIESRRISDITEVGQIVYDVDGVVVKAYSVDHSPVSPSLGYRVEYQGRSIGISGDTIDTPGIRQLAAGADILVAEVMDAAFALDQACALDRIGDARNAQIFRDVRTYHTEVGQLAQLSADVGVERLMLTHYLPSLPPSQTEQLFSPQITPLFFGELILSEDGSRAVIDLE